MPELPEVETIRRGLQKRVLNKQIRSLWNDTPNMLRGNPQAYKKALEGTSFTSIERRGKLLIFSLQNSENRLLAHLKMTGQLIYQEEEEMVAGGHPFPSFTEGLPNAYTHIVFEFETGKLYFNDLRKFGFLQLVTPTELSVILDRYGIEPGLPNFQFEAFHGFFTRSVAPVKSILLDQTKIAGLGNIYVDEVCFEAQIRPDRKGNTLTEAELSRLFTVIPEVIEMAIEHRGTTFHTFIDSDGRKGNHANFLKVYQQEGKTCPHCGGTIIKTKVAGRGTHFCPDCQF